MVRCYDMKWFAFFQLNSIYTFEPKNLDLWQELCACAKLINSKLPYHHPPPNPHKDGNLSS